MKIQEFVTIQIHIKAFSQDEIIARIPNDILEKIREKDEHPFFQMYSICHEGVSEPKIEGKGYQPIYWFKQAVQSIKNVFKAGIKFFDGHNKSNDSPDKPELGEVIYAFEEMINDKLNYCVIGYFPPETRDRAAEMDICSQEAQWDLIDVAGKLIADTCNKVTGIALGNSKYQQPAFENAKRLAFVQAFDKLSPDGESGTGEVPKEKKIMTFEEIKKAAKELNVMPHQLFTVEEIKGDREFGKVFEEIDNLTKVNKNKDEEITKLTKENSDLNRNFQLQTAKGTLSKIYKENRLTDNMENFITEMYEENKKNINDVSEEGLKKFVYDQIKIFQKATGITNTQNDEKKEIPAGDEKIEDNKTNPFVDKYEEDEYI